MLQTKVYDEIDEIGKSTLDSLSENFFFSYGWFKTVETARVFTLVPKYITVYDKGRIVAVAPCFVEYTSQYQTVEDFLLPSGRKIGKLRLVLHEFVNPSLVCYSPSSFQSRILADSNVVRSEVLKLVLSQIDKICMKERILFSSFKFVSEFDALVFNNLESFGYLKSFLKSNMFVDVTWNSFDEYLKSIRNAGVRSKVRKEIRINRKAGVKIEEHSLDSLVDVIPKLYSNLYLKYNRKPSPLTFLFFKTLDLYNRNKTLVFVAKKRDRMLGFSLFLKHKDVWDCYIVGFDYKNLGKDYTYFNIVFYVPIEKAISEGAKRINFRPGTFEAKRRRGCRREKLFFFVKCQSGLLAPLFVKGIHSIGKRLGVPYTSH